MFECKQTTKSNKFGSSSVAFFSLPVKFILTRAERCLDSIGITRMTDNVLNTPEGEEMGRVLE